MKSNLPDWELVPVAVPPAESDRPGGNVPSVIDHWYGGLPPDPVTWTGAYAMPTSPLWNGRLVMANAVPTGEATADADAEGLASVTAEVLGEGLVDGLADGLAVIVAFGGLHVG